MIERPSSHLLVDAFSVTRRRSRRALLVLVATAVTAVALTGCGGGSDEPDVPSEGDESEQTGAEVSGPPVLGPVVWSTSIVDGTSEPANPVAEVPVEADAIYAVFPVERLATGTKLRATWTFNGEPLEGLDADLDVPRDQIGGWLEFHLERGSSDPWPDGQYGISLTTDSILVATGSVQVVRGSGQE